MLKKNGFFLGIVFGLQYFACGEDRLRLNNAQEKWFFSWHCLRLALSLPAAKIGGALG